eukprot:GEMP01003075.1.p1 GENE.GEMP01003075.1~~GEMP01003075.1.p1  ORF type:complete len:432 (+),score=74.52 GEMP01003075.1:63-1298(+)
MGRKSTRGFTVSVGRSAGDVVGFERNEHRANTLPTDVSRRADFAISEADMQKLKQKQEALLGRVRRGSIFLGAATEEQFVEYWKTQTTCHVYGRHTEKQAPAEERELEHVGLSPDQYLKELNIVFSCVKGFKGRGDSTPNQDNFSVTVYNSGWIVYCVMDGHGPNGHFVSTRTVQSLPYYLGNSPFFPNEMKDALTETFDLTNKDLLGHALQANFDVQASGSTCVVCVRNPEGDKLWTGWVGDSRIVIGYETEKGLQYETKDHKPECVEEKARIEKSGGEVRTFRYEDDWTINRIFVRGMDYPGLCMSRSFGDECVKACGVSCEPTIGGPISIDLSKNPFILLASDGVWEFLDSEWVVKAITKKLPTEGPSKVVHKLSKEARRRWKQEEGDYCDDITVALVLLGKGAIPSA